MSIFLGNRWWERKFCWLPKRCELSDTLIWLEYAYRGRRPTGSDFVWHSVYEHHKWADEVKRRIAERYNYV